MFWNRLQRYNGTDYSATMEPNKTLRLEPRQRYLHINDNAGVVAGIKRRIKLFKDRNNRATTDTITQELDDDGNLQSTLVSKYGYAHDVDFEDLQDINNIQTMVRNFNAVITNYLTNGAV